MTNLHITKEQVESVKRYRSNCGTGYWNKAAAIRGAKRESFDGPYVVFSYDFGVAIGPFPAVSAWGFAAVSDLRQFAMVAA